ncbi:hypothetical protein O6H91_15G008300 [Diphasiastrum complanatum]|uniref:Uncharacterized protein n=1 Tax=Diphasiastrum complanatum TaxID=34168 RepID=A0ACC2BFS4_DIPCM|nr:hypothetical protein O6H91_15G008300 [Diphasiastrum complanatum]
MATLQDLGIAAAINIVVTFLFLLAFALLKLQPINHRVYYSKLYINGLRRVGSKGDQKSRRKFLNLDLKQLKIFMPLMLLGFMVLIPVNVTDNNLSKMSHQIYYTNVDKISIANVQSGSQRLWVHLLMTYVFTIWTCFMLYKEYKTVAEMRFEFLAAEGRRPDQFTVLVRQIPVDPDESVNVHVEHFFRVNHADFYLGHQVVYNASKLVKLVKKKESAQNWLDYFQLKYARNPSVRPSRKRGFCGLWGEVVDSINYSAEQIDQLSKEAAAERERVLGDEKAILPVAFVSFKTRWGAAVCAQTQQSKNPTLWLTDWAPEPRDVYWDNLGIPYVEQNIRRLLVTGALIALILFFIIPVTFVQSLANLDGLEKIAKFLRPITERHFVRSFLQGFLPGLVLKLFLLLLPSILMLMSKIEGHVSLSMLDKVTAAKYYYFMVINVFFASILTGAAFEQLNSFVHQSASEIPKTLGNAIPMKATFFITFIMVDGWSSIAGDILRIWPLIIYHLKCMFLVKTEKDRENAMSPGSANFDIVFPQVELYFLLGTVYAIITPFILPFIIVYFGFAYIAYRHQVINVFNPEYESAAAFWPHIHNRIVASLIFEQIALLGLFSSKRAADSTPFLIGLPVLTLAFHIYCKNRFEPAFLKYPLQEAMTKDTIDKALQPDFGIKSFLQNAYTHPIFKTEDDNEESRHLQSSEDQPTLICTTRSTHAKKVVPIIT